MQALPVALRLEDSTCLVVGAGEVALRKVELLLSAGARVRLVAPRIHGALQGRRQVECHLRPYASSDLSGVTLVIAATNDTAVNRVVSGEARERGIPVNVVDSPALCTFMMPSIVERGRVWAAVSSGGAAPVLARTLRGQIEALLPERVADLAELLHQYRPQIRALFVELNARRAFIERVLSGPIADHVYAGDYQAAERLLLQSLQRSSTTGETRSSGCIWCVGAGPGDPDWLTLHAQRVLLQADQIRVAVDLPPAILARCRRDARVLPVDRATTTGGRLQELTASLIEEVHRGARIALVMPGADPDPLGVRGALVQAGLTCTLLPGVGP